MLPNNFFPPKGLSLVANSRWRASSRPCYALVARETTFFVFMNLNYPDILA